MLYIHGDLPMCFVEPVTEHALERAGVKLICLSMPGHGSSDPPPKGVRQMEDGLAAIDCMIDHLGHSRVPVAASFSGMTYPMALGARPEPRVSAMPNFARLRAA
ncbi:MAG: alpha/beta fold hydrolase [Erythrobacter sp.]